MEKSSARSLYQCFSLVEAVAYLFLDWILVCVCRLKKFPRSFATCSSKSQGTQLKITTTTELIKREDVDTVMERIGMSISREGEKFKACIAFDIELANMFEEEEPSFEEVEEAFRVFDENCDGFIDAADMQRVLSKLGFPEGADIEACRLMIEAHDQDLDGRVDFNDFVRLMESSLC